MAGQLLVLIKVKTVYFCNAVRLLALVRGNHVTDSKGVKRIVFCDAALEFSGKVSRCRVNQGNGIMTVKKTFEQDNVLSIALIP